MELVPRGSLRPYMKQLTMAQIGGILEGVLAGLAHAEAAGIVHRDLKPENIMVTADGRVKIADFGIARATQRAGTQFMTATGMTVGTPTYMAPEQAMASEIGPWTDLYSVGVLAYEMVVGEVPFAGTEAPVAILMKHVNERIPSPIEVRPDVNPALSRWIDSLLVKDPNERVRHATIAWEQLEEILVNMLGPLWRRNARLLDDSLAARDARPLTPAPFESKSSIRTPTPEPSPAAASFVTFDPHRIAPAAAPIDIKPPPGPPPLDVESGTPAAVEPEPAAATVEPEPAAAVVEPEPAAATAIEAEPIGAVEASAAVAVPAAQTEAPTPAVQAPTYETVAPIPAVQSATPDTVAPIPAMQPEVAAPVEPEPAAARMEAEPPAESRTQPPGALVTPLQPTPHTGGARVATAPARRRGRGARIGALAAVVAIAAAAIGFLVAPGSGGTSRHPAGLTGHATAGALTISYPNSWRRSSAAPPETASLELADAVTISPGEPARDGALVVGTSKAQNVTLLSPTFSSSLRSSPEGEAVKLGSQTFIRYLDLVPSGASTPMSVYVLPTTLGIATAVCVAPTTGATAFAVSCERAVGSMTTSGSVLPFGANPAYASALSAIVAKLNSVRTQAGLRLATAKSPKAQAAAALELSDAHATAAAAAEKLTPGPATAAAAANVVIALKQLASGYEALSRATSAGNGGDYSAAASAIKHADAALSAAFARLRQAGYTIG